MMTNNLGALTWDVDLTGSEVNSKPAYIKLDERDYDIKVASFERGMFPGSAKMCACNKITLNIEVDTPQGTATIKDDLIMHQRMIWKVTEVFASLGLIKVVDGKVVEGKIDWSKLTGATGRAHVYQRPYKDKEGVERTTNAISKYLPPVPVPEPTKKDDSIDWEAVEAGELPFN